ncbi:hypothetical protein FPCIR_9247 [Fusarium pseudocircinatum]|uniref:Zinc-binding loop region of homing endonuclease domain-containing protein n=1 Tax=Fusarium pseudocircinatum TaxID=56676 RepID=A0A8H5KYF3_9HYPO|nr:hypothetical protein FPCIR_9247 [Fusarium pseudocircinatum]
MGDLKGLTTSLSIITADYAPESEYPQHGSAIRAAYSSGGSAPTNSRFDDKPIPIDLTGSSSARKRRATEEPADRTEDGIPTTARPWPQELLVVSDSIANGNDPAEVFGALAYTLRKRLSPSLPLSAASYAIIQAEQEVQPTQQLSSVLRHFQGSGSRSASGTSKRFNDKPIPIDLTGSSRKRQARDHDLDEDLLGALNAPTTTPTQALLVLPWEWPKITPSLPLSAVIRMAGIHKSFVISIDMPLYVPNPDSIAMASYVSSITNIRFFANEADTRQLAKETVSTMKGLGWQPSVGLAIQYRVPAAHYTCRVIRTLPNDTPVNNGSLARSLPNTPVRFGTMRTKNQLSRLLQEAYNSSPTEFHQKVDRAHAQFLHKFSTTQESFLTRMQPVFNNGNCFSGFYQVFPSATLTQLVQMLLHTEKRQTWALFSMYEINFSIFRDAAPRAQRKAFYILVNHTRNELQGLLTCETEVSHRCNWRRCINPDHITLESHSTNLSRSTCFKQAAGHFGANLTVKEFCDIHEPPCLLQQATLPTTAKVINEWIAMERPLPDALPEQMDCLNAELLTAPINQYTWVEDRRVVAREYTIPEVNNEYKGTQAPGMMYSGILVKEMMEE